eukprot:CAMPEP_0119316254 /NCGR_PEP_ID=MMETSP1333-20130426/39188_1 /TAXON_ID=418940 /ORGANISM="Scyphosphaera apsteinii, Strain RCC1455" /LENGTH=685 /DNA_ID=CAMNT_0007321855 /DNA_START=36 /DNA_END=2093 /DNA_ORIENTATION=-
MSEYAVTAAGPEMDDVVVRNWREQWLSNNRPAGNIAGNQKDLMLAYIREARDKLQHMSFVARCSCTGTVIGSAACQLWSGPMPIVVTEKVGTVWGVFVQPKWRRKGVATLLMQSVIDYWQSIGCQRGVLLCASEEARRIYERLGFGAGHMLQLDLLTQPGPCLPTELVALPTERITVTAEANAEAHVCEHLRAVWREAGVPCLPDLEERTTAFIVRAKERLEYQAFLARDGGGVVGAASCHVWEGPGSNNSTWQSLIKLGVCWGLHAERRWPKNEVKVSKDQEKASTIEVKARLLESVIDRWRTTSCTRGLVIASSASEAAFYRRYGFEPHNAMVINLSRSKSPISPMELGGARATKPLRSTVSKWMGAAANGLTTEEEAFIAVVRATSAELAQRLSSMELASLRLALPQMLEAALPATHAGKELRAAVVAAQRECGTFVNGSWYTSNIVRFGGGFDMKQLTAQPGKLAAKFDRLADKYDDWTVGNQCTYYGWIASCARAAGELRGKEASILDVACGIGLPGHMLRLCGFQGHMSGTDLSAGMISRARERRVYDHLFIANANEGLAEVKSASLDLVLCVGAMELLDHRTVLSEFVRILRPGGKLWASFQWEGAVDEAGLAIASPTEHQNISGVMIPQLIDEIEAAGFDSKAAIIEKTTCAFYTPSPRQDGTVLPVPYLYLQVGLA